MSNKEVMRFESKQSTDLVNQLVERAVIGAKAAGGKNAIGSKNGIKLLFRK